MPKNTHRKNRSPFITHQNKVDKITNWYNKLIAYREKNPIAINPNTKLEPKRKELKPLSWYLEKIKQPKNDK